MTDTPRSLTMNRIIGSEKKNRIQIRVYIEKELVEAIKAHTLEPNDTFNIALEKHLRDKQIHF